MTRASCSPRIENETGLPSAHGSVVRRTAVAGFRVTLARYREGTVLRPHRHDHPGIVFIAAGHVAESFAGGEIAGGPGTLIRKGHDIRHGNRFGPKGAVLVVIEMTDRSSAAGVVDPYPALIGSFFSRVVGDRLAAILEESESPSDIAVMSGAVDLWAAVAAPKPLRPSRRIDRAVERIHDDVGSVTRMKTLADFVGVHPVYLARGFRERFGCSLSGYIRRIRLHRAADSVRGGDRTLAEIATETGFADQAHMTRAFRNYFGTTPAAFRTAREGLAGSRRL